MDFLSMTREQVEALPENQAAEVMEAWVKAKKPELPQALTQSNSKLHAKLAKKALYRLQSAGVTVQSASPSETAPVLNDAPVEFEGVLSMQLGSGERAFLGAIPVKGGGIEVFQGIVHDELGLAQLGSERSNRATWRKHVATLQNDQSTRTMIVPFARLQLELGRALFITRRDKVDLDTEIEQALQRLNVTPVSDEVVVPPLEPGDEASAGDGAKLHQLFELTQWMPSEKDLVTLGQRVDALKVLPLSDEQRKEKSEKLARELAAETFTAPTRALYARRLVYTAELLEHSKRPEEAKQVLAEARRLAHTSLPSVFAEQLFIKVVSNLPKSVSAQLGLTPK
jgi:hypothetical protein